MKFNWKQINIQSASVTALVVASMGVTGCSAKAPAAATASAPAADVGITGKLASVAHVAAQRRGKSLSRPIVKAMDYTGDKVVCATISNPPITGEADVASDGSFTLTMVGGVNQPMNCNLVDANKVVLAQIVATDDSHKDINGGSTNRSTLALTASANLGDISYDPSTGKASIPVANIQTQLSSAATDVTVFDPSGTWTIAAVPFDLPAGFHDLCPENQQNGGCNGPPAGQQIALKQFTGIAGDNSKVYGLQIWDNPAGLPACGSMLGLSPTEQNKIGVDFSSYGSAADSFKYADHVTINNASKAVTDDYMIDGATSTFDMQLGCSSKPITLNGVTVQGWVCGADDNGLYQASVGGGCVDATTGASVMMNGSWTPVGNSVNTDLGSGYTSQVQNGTYNDQSIVCTFVGGTFSDSGLTAPSNSQFDWTYMNDPKNGLQLASGTDCSDSHFSDLQKEQCYIQYFQQNLGDHSSACLKRVDYDWSSTDASTAIHKGNNPRALVAFNQFFPDPTGLGGGLRNEQTQFQGVQSASGNGWTVCETFEVDEFAYTKIDDSTMLTTFQSTTITTDTSKPDCVAAFGSAGNGSVQKFLFLLKK